MAAARKSVLITGCSKGGIGDALALAFERKDLHVFATARSLSKIAHLSQFPHVTCIALDVTSPDSIAAAVAIVTKKTGGSLDFLINNAGLGIVSPALEADLQDGKKMFEANFWGAVSMVQAFGPLIIAAKGTIGNVAALGAILHIPWMSLYGASKAALVSWTEVLRMEMAPFEVKVVPIMTGFVHTNIFNQGHEIELPKDSIYWPVHMQINSRSAGTDVKDKMDATVYANKVVGDLLGGADGRIYRGGMSSGAKFITTFLPNSMVDKMMLGGTGLDKPQEITTAHMARNSRNFTKSE